MGGYAKDSEKITKSGGLVDKFIEILCYHAADKRIRLQEQKLWGFYPGKEVLKTIFWLR